MHTMEVGGAVVLALGTYAAYRLACAASLAWVTAQLRENHRVRGGRSRTGRRA
jgi:hypothetical protein